MAPAGVSTSVLASVSFRQIGAGGSERRGFRWPGWAGDELVPVPLSHRLVPVQVFRCYLGFGCLGF